MNHRVESQLKGEQRPQRGRGTSEEGGNGETKAKAEGEETRAGMEAVETSVDGLERVSATTFSGPGMWTMELVNSAR